MLPERPERRDGVARLIKRSVVVGITTSVLSLLGAQVAAAQWSIQSIPNPPGGGDLLGVSCATGSSCVAVGQRFNGYGHGGPTGLVESWNGTQWRWTAASKPRDAVFQGVSCVSSDACTAVGYDENARGDEPGAGGALERHEVDGSGQSRQRQNECSVRRFLRLDVPVHRGRLLSPGWQWRPSARGAMERQAMEDPAQPWQLTTEERPGRCVVCIEVLSASRSGRRVASGIP